MSITVDTISFDFKRDTSTHPCSISFTSIKDQNCIFLSELLHLEEAKYFNSLVSKNRRCSYFLGRFAAKSAIIAQHKSASHADIWIDHGIFQFPIIRSPLIRNFQISIAHSDYSASAIAFGEEHPIGIDMEKIDYSKSSAIVSLMTESERNIIQKAASSTLTKFAIFSLKEALSKIIKTGMMIDFSLLETEELAIEPNGYSAVFKHFKQYRGIVFVSNKYVFSMVHPKRSQIDQTDINNIYNSFRSYIA